MDAIKKEWRKSKRTVTQPEEVNESTPLATPIALPSIEVEDTPIASVIAPAVVEATPSETAPKSPLRLGEWSHAELRKHFNKY